MCVCFVGSDALASLFARRLLEHVVEQSEAEFILLGAWTSVTLPAYRCVCVCVC